MIQYNWVFLSCSVDYSANTFYSILYSLTNVNGLSMKSKFKSWSLPAGDYFYQAATGSVFSWGPGSFYSTPCNCTMAYVRVYLDYSASQEVEMKNLATMDNARKYLFLLIARFLTS